MSDEILKNEPKKTRFYVRLDERVTPVSGARKFMRFWARALKGELFTGLLVVLKEMLFSRSHTLKYPMQKLELSPRQRGVHRLMRFIESQNERCIGCGLCEKICVSNCIAMQTGIDEDGRKTVANYSINLGRCVYCGFCADVCPELAIVHGGEYELASEQRAYYGFKHDFLTPRENLSSQVEFPGYGSLPQDADSRVKKTPCAQEIEFLNAKNQGEISSDEAKDEK